MNGIVIRDIAAGDIPAIKDVVREVWAWEDFFDDHAIIDACVAIYFAPVLHGATFGRVALLDGKVVGVVFGAVDGERPSYKHLLEDLTPQILLMLQADELDRLGMCEYISKQTAVYKDLITGIKGEYGGTLDFLVLSKSAQGKGIGKRLWLALKEYLEAKSVAKVFLFSDSECNFGFYEKQGFVRRSKMDMSVVVDGEEDVTEQYLYEYRFDGKATVQ